MRATFVTPATARPLLAASLAAALSFAGSASAVDPACNLLTDPAGDATGFVVTDPGPLPNDPNLDVVSGDVATDAKTLTAVLRTAEQALSDSNAPTGRAYYANFTVDGVDLFLSASLDSAGAATFGAGYIDDTGRAGLGAATGVVDVTKKEVRISAPLSVFAEQAPIKPGTKILDLNLLAQRFVGAAGKGATPSADAAEGGKAYTAGSPSCVVPGK